jgi:hypothetical protein
MPDLRGAIATKLSQAVIVRLDRTIQYSRDACDGI